MNDKFYIVANNFVGKFIFVVEYVTWERKFAASSNI